MKLTDRIQHAWGAFTNNKLDTEDYGYSSWSPTFKQANTYNSSQFVASIYNRIAIDVSMSRLKHVKIDPKTEDVETITSGLNYCLNVEANIDQTSIQFIQDVVYSMFDEGVVAVVPVETTISPRISESYDIKSLRVGKIVQWYPKHIRVRLYNETTGQNEEITVPKQMAAIVENPLYAIMNANNSTLKRLVRKISQLDEFDDSASSGRLDLIIQVPYGIKTNAQRVMAENRIKDLEAQLSIGKHGITYMDSTEKITQLNRPIQSQLPETIDRLTKQFYNQLGLTQTIFDGTATEEQLRIYYSRTIDPIIENMLSEFSRKFLTKTARTQGQAIQYYRDMFKFVTVEMISSLGDTVRRNSILTSNEVRKILGVKASNDPRADDLYNPNIATDNQLPMPDPPVAALPKPELNVDAGLVTPPANDFLSKWVKK